MQPEVFAQKSKITKKNIRRFGYEKKVSELKEGSTGDEGPEKKYNIQEPRKEAKKIPSVKVDISKAEKKRKSAEMSTDGSGDLPAKPKEKDKSSNTTLKIGFVDDSKQRMHNKADEMLIHGSGDIPLDHWINKQIEQADHGIYNATDRGVIPDKVLKQKKAAMKSLSYEISNNTGDIQVSYQSRMRYEKDRGKAAGSYQGTIDAGVLTRQKAATKNLSSEMSKNQGDIPLTYERTAQYAKDKSHKAAIHTGSVDASVIAVAKRKIKSSDREIGQNQGDLIDNYIARRNRIRDKSRQMASYTGSIDLAKIKSTAKTKAHEQAIHRGDILVRTAKARENSVRNRSKVMSSYKGEIIVTAKRRGTHPSSEYRGGMLKDSYAAKERLRKSKVRQFRRQRSKEDPEYMRKSQPKPRYETEEYKIWESKTR